MRIALMMVCMLMTGCASLGLQSPPGLDGRIDQGYSNLIAFINTANLSIDQGTLSKEDGKKVLELAEQSRAILKTADQALVGGDPKTAEGQLALALATLARAQEYLANQEAKRRPK